MVDLTSLKASPASVCIRRGYTNCRYGQLHFVSAKPRNTVSNKYPVLVLLHQNPSSSVEYKWLIAEMAKDRCVIAFDTPGNGMSDWPDAPLSIGDYARAFADGLDNLNIGKETPVDVYGYHTGTLLAAELALLQPDRVGRVVMSGIPYRSPEERQAQLDKIHATQPPTDDGDEIFKRLRWLWQFLVAERAPGIPIERAAEMFAERAKPLHRYWWPYDGVWTYEVDERFPLIRQPVFVFQPHEDLLENSIRAAQLIQAATVVDMPDLQRDIFEPETGLIPLTTLMRHYLI